MKTALLFPGQGSQYSGMGKDLYDNFSVAREVFDSADDYLGFKLSSICFEGDDETLKQTKFTQPAIATVSIALLEVLKKEVDLEYSMVLGHSLGEYSALYSAGVINLEQTMKLLYKRGSLMSSVAEGGMAAVIGATDEIIKSAINEVSEVGYIGIANYNSESQTVITGDKKALLAIEEVFKEKGIKKFIPLQVSGAFHSDYMKKIVPEYKKFLTEFTLNDADVPIITNVDAKAEFKATNIKDKMLEQLYSSVLWYQSIGAAVEQGCDRFLELGPGKVLSGLNKRIVPDCNTSNISDMNSLKQFVEMVEKE